MSGSVRYFYFGRQCPGFYMGQQAQRAAEILGYDYCELDISQRPDIALEYNLFCAGTIVINDFHIHFPSTPEQLVESYRTKSPLSGEHAYIARQADELDETKILVPATAGLAFRQCIPSLADDLVHCKQQWMEQYTKAQNFAGLIGFKGDKPVSFVEVLPETDIPYPIGEKKPDRAFITCIYCPTEWGLEYDYRQSLLSQLCQELKARGYTHLSVVSGVETPYPNGPEVLFASGGFDRVKYMGKTLLRHKWEDAWLMKLILNR